jgi:hypothetical protein
VTTTRTESVTRTVAAEGTLPAAVERTRASLLEAARTGDYEQLRPLVPDALEYTFGGPVEGGAIAFWQRLENDSGASPIQILAGLLELPYTLHRGIYVWPFAFDKQPDELTEYDRGLLESVGGEDLREHFGEGIGYLGWRTGIEPDGDWVFFVAGD